MITTTQTLISGEFSTRDIELAAVLKKEGVSFIDWREEGSFVFQASEKITEIKRKHDNGELQAGPNELVYLKALTVVCRK